MHVIQNNHQTKIPLLITTQKMDHTRTFVHISKKIIKEKNLNHTKHGSGTYVRSFTFKKN